MKSATAVFEGRVVSIQRGGEAVAKSDVQVTFDVVGIWKAPMPSVRILVFTSANSSCGRSFVDGRSYLVFAGGDDERLTDNLCSATVDRAEANGAIQALGPAMTPPPASNDGAGEPVLGDRGCAIGLATSAAGPIWCVLAVLAACLLRRRRAT